MPREFNGKRKIFSTNGTEITDSPYAKKKKINSYLTFYLKKKKEKTLRMYHTPDDNGLVPDRS